MNKSNFTFSTMPSVSISRSKFNRTSQHKMSMNLGDINVIYCDEVLPGDTRSMEMASLVRMSNPIAPIMDNIYMDYFAFFVPARLTWIHWKEFMGENNTGAGIPLVTYNIPVLGDTDYDPTSPGNGNTINVGSYGDQMGLPVNVSDTFRNKISALPFRGLALIYNRWFRNQNLIAPLAVQTGDTDEVIVGEVANDNYSIFAADKSSVLKASKLPDYFVSALPYAQKGGAVAIPLGTYAPIRDNGYGNYGQVLNQTASSFGGGLVGLGADATNAGKHQLVADLKQATAATINQLRYAFQLQKLLEKDALYGTRYAEILKAHFGTISPDASLQDPEYLGGSRMNVNIDQVLSTAGYSNTSSTTVGAPGANSVSGFKGHLFSKSFTEHGYLYILAVARHDSTYGQGIDRMWSRQGRYDFYWPVMANLGAQEIKKKEIFMQGTSDDDEVWGYQEAWAEYRYKRSFSSSLLNPAVSGSLDYWTLGENFATLPTLGQTFVEQGRGNLARALVTSTTGPDFICDFYFKDVCVRPMPTYSIPGLIDHH